MFDLDKIYRGGIDYFYLGAFDKDYGILQTCNNFCVDFIEGTMLYISLQGYRSHNVENMKKYDITDKFKDIDILFK